MVIKPSKTRFFFSALNGFFGASMAHYLLGVEKMRASHN